MPTPQESSLLAEATLDPAERRHLEALREAGIPKALEADAMASFRGARYAAKLIDAVFGVGEPKLDVFAGSRAAYTAPLWCSACGARYSQDCSCPKYAPPLRGDEDPV